MDIVSIVFGGIGVTLLAYVFSKLGVSDHAQRAIVFVLCVIGAVVKLLLSHSLTVSWDLQTWFIAITSIQGVAQMLYGLVAAGLKWGSGTAATTPNPT
jgi:hypothetical protein